MAVPRRDEMVAALVAAVPFAAAEPLKILELGSGDGQLAEALLTVFPAATLTALDGSESMRLAAGKRLRAVRRSRARRALRRRRRSTGGIGCSVSTSSCRRSACTILNDAKKQYLYKAAAERLSPRGALLIADLIDPQHPASRALAADQWDAQAKRQADAVGAPPLYQRFLDERWNHFRFPDPMDQPSALFHHLSGCATRGLRQSTAAG